MHRFATAFVGTCATGWRKFVFVEGAKDEALTFLAQQRERIMRMSHEDALRELISVHKIDSKERVIRNVSENGILGFA